MLRSFLSVVPLFICGCTADGDDDTSPPTTTDTGTPQGTDTSTGDTGVPDAGTPDPLAIAGVYSGSYGGQHEITDTQWTQTYTPDPPLVFAISRWDNDAMWLVAQNDEANAYNASLWSRFDWITDGTTVTYCQGTTDAATEQDALDSAPANADDLGTGCGGGFPWTVLSP